jgi:hypothetical protein
MVNDGCVYLSATMNDESKVLLSIAAAFGISTIFGFCNFVDRVQHFNDGRLMGGRYGIRLIE